MNYTRTPGACFCCDEMCFEVEARWDEGEELAGLPKRLGAPMNGATRIQFELFDGSGTDLTFCGKCAKSLTPAQYPALWRKVMCGWIKRAGPQPEWIHKAQSNGILIELRRFERTKSEATGVFLA